jgi:hypothetical protein
MKKTIISILVVSFVLFIATADYSYAKISVRVIGGSAAAARTYLFEEDFEGTDTTWDNTNGTEDCTFDSQGDWCDDYTTSPAPINGSESLGFRAGRNEAHVREGLGGSYTELYYDFWYHTEDITGVNAISLRDASNNEVLRFFINSSSQVNMISAAAQCTDTATTLTADTDWHFRIYYKEGAGDGAISIWSDTVDTDFDGDTADKECTSLTTDTDNVTQVQMPGCDGDTGNGDDCVYDDVLVWEPDGDE